MEMMYVTSHVKHFERCPIYYNLLSLASKVFSELYGFSSEFNIFEYTQCHVDNISNFKYNDINHNIDTILYL